MTRYRVVFRSEAVEQLDGLYDFIADAASPGNAAGFTESIIGIFYGGRDHEHLLATAD